MRISPVLSAVVLCAASVGVAYAQTSSSEVSRTPVSRSSAANGLSFAYDAQHGLINATGVQLSAVSRKSSTVTPTTGTITVTINTKIVSHFGTNETYHCSVYAVGGVINLLTGTVDGGVETANAFARITSPGTATCTLKIPYSWTLSQSSGGDSGLILAYAVGAVTPQSEVQRSTLQVDGIENLPANGTTSTYTFDVEL